jgi:hypothetical protein
MIASDNTGVSLVDVQLDGNSIGSDNSQPYEIVWDTALDTDGVHNLTARATDAAGNVGTANITVTVRNSVTPPPAPPAPPPTPPPAPTPPPVAPPPASPPPTPNPTPPTSNPQMLVWRLYNPGLNNHFYTLSVEERDFAAGKLGYRLEGAAFIAFNNPGPGLVPVYRLYSPHARLHFFTADQNEANVIQTIGYRMDGVVFYSFNTPDAGRYPIYRLLFPRTGKHFYSGSLPETQALVKQGWRFEGAAWYAL